jgi:hypothetical protein
MTAAADDSFPDNHAETVGQWQSRFSAKKLAMPPFADFVSDLWAMPVTSELALITSLYADQARAVTEVAGRSGANAVHLQAKRRP